MIEVVPVTCPYCHSDRLDFGEYPVVSRQAQWCDDVDGHRIRGDVQIPMQAKCRDVIRCMDCGRQFTRDDP